MAAVVALSLRALAGPRQALSRGAGIASIDIRPVLQRLDIADAVKGKTLLWPGGYAAEAVADGRAEIVVHQISEILPVKGITLVGPLPKDLKKITIYSAGLATKAGSPEAALAFIAYLMSAPIKAKFAGAGLDYRD
jgi:molybdate transport system substrate-binding protein